MKTNEINPTKELKSIKCDVCAKIFKALNEQWRVRPKSVAPIVIRNILIFSNQEGTNGGLIESLIGIYAGGK